MSLKLYYFESCPYCQIVLEFIDNHDLEIEQVDIHENPSEGKWLRETTGKGQVPCLFIDEKPMWESRDIIAYLAANHT